MIPQMGISIARCMLISAILKCKKKKRESFRLPKLPYAADNQEVSPSIYLLPFLKFEGRPKKEQSEKETQVHATRRKLCIFSKAICGPWTPAGHSVPSPESRQL